MMYIPQESHCLKRELVGKKTLDNGVLCVSTARAN
jgi:hypothetical protein